MKAGLVSFVGRPNAGKSTLMNQLMGQKVAIVSDKPQTTRHRITGVRNEPDGQIVFIDTPGIHKPVHRMNERMVHAALDTLREVDVVVLVVDVTERPGLGDRYVTELVRDAGRKTIVVLNKIDRLKKKTDLLPLMESYSKALTCEAIIPMAAFHGEGLEALVRELLAALPEGTPMFDADYFTDQTERTLAAELIREKVLRHTREELPYMTAVVIDQFQEPATPGEPTKIYASILVDHQSQKPIVIGRQGELIRRIGTEARVDLEELLQGKVFLDLHVKVRGDWRDDERLLDELGLRR